MSFAHNDFNAPPPAAKTSPEAATRILMLFQTKGLGPRVKTGLETTNEILVTTHAGRLPADRAALAGYDMVIFETDARHGFDIDALQDLKAQPGEGPRLLALIEANLSLSDARRLMDAGVEEVLPLSALAPPSPAATATQDVSRPPEATAQEPHKNGKVTIILRARGGAGASTLAVNLAAQLSEPSGKGTHDAKSVALVDLDIQNGSIGVLLDLPDSTEFTALIRDRAIPDIEFMQTAIVSLSPTFKVLPTPDELAPLTALNAAVLTSLLDQLQAQYDHVILDMPHAIMDWLDPILGRAALVLIVTDTSVPAIKQTKRLVDLVTEDHMTLPVEVVVNKERRPLIPNAVIKEATNVLGVELKHWIPSDPKAIRKSSDAGKPLHACAKRSAATLAIAKLANTLRNRDVKPAPEAQ